MTLLPVFIPWLVGLLMGVALGMAYYQDRNKPKK